MRIGYQNPWFLRPKASEPQTNPLTRGNYTITLKFKVEKDFSQDKKIGFWGIPGKNFGISYDYEYELFVFEFWTIDENDELKFNCHTYDAINPKQINEGITVTVTYDGHTYMLYKNFKLIDMIENSQKLVTDYINEPIYIGCHNIDSINPKHRCMTEIDVEHFSIFNEVIDIKTLNKIVSNKKPIKEYKEFENLYCLYDLTEIQDEIILVEENKGLFFLKKKNKMSSIGFELMRDKLNTVGNGFCLAKWTQVTMHLHNGTTHSCHHPEPHKVGLGEISRNPTSLHNSKNKKLARKEMLQNHRPAECQYCWNVEDTSNSFSDRIFKSSEPWSEPYFNEISKLDWRDDYNPKYVEVSFSNTCNFKCAYCGPEYSSKWMEEINSQGPYNLSYEYNGLRRMEERNTKPYKQTEENPYVNAFWEWFPDLYKSLDTFRITGGEPLLSKDTWKVLDYIITAEDVNVNLKLSINSNLGVTDDLIDKLIEKLDIITRDNRIKEMVIFTSCDGYGKQAEYTRFGLDFEKLFFNIDKILTKLPRVTVVVMSTFNIFSVFSYEDLIKNIYQLKVKHFNTKRYWNSAIILDTSYLRHPPFMSFRLLKNYISVDYFDRWIKYMKFFSSFRSLNFHRLQEITDVGFSAQEIEKISRIKDIFIADYSTDDKEFNKDRIDLYNFVNEYEKRRKFKCVEFFPELEDFFKKIKDENKL